MGKEELEELEELGRGEFVEIHCMKFSDLIFKNKMKEVRDSTGFLKYLSQCYSDMRSKCRNLSHNIVGVNPPLDTVLKHILKYSS